MTQKNECVFELSHEETNDYPRVIQSLLSAPNSFAFKVNLLRLYY